MSPLRAPQSSAKPISHHQVATRQTQQERRLQAATRISQGEHPNRVAASLGMSRAWAYQCFATLRTLGPASLLASAGGGRPSKLTAEQQNQVFGWLNGKRPDQYDLTGGLWTQRRVQQLVLAQLGIELSILTVAKLLSRLGLTPPRPRYTANTQTRLGNSHWQRTQRPSIAGEGAITIADLLLCEMRACTHSSAQQLWAVNLQGAFWFSTCPNDYSAAQFVTLMKRLMRGRQRPVRLVVGLNQDSWRANPLVQDYLKTTRGRLTLHSWAPPHLEDASAHSQPVSRPIT